jgi:hypothetical protein
VEDRRRGISTLDEIISLRGPLKNFNKTIKKCRDETIQFSEWHTLAWQAAKRNKIAFMFEASKT